VKLHIACDHAATETKDSLKQKLAHIEWVDHGTQGSESVNYPDFAGKVCSAILKEQSELTQPQGILICGSGVGMSMAANRHKGIRAVLAYNSEVTMLSRQHNASNVLCLGSRLQNLEQMISIIETWLKTEFEKGRHQNRIDLMDV